MDRLAVKIVFIEKKHLKTAYLGGNKSGFPDFEISEKRNFFTLRPVTRKRRQILGWAIKREKAGIHRRTNTFRAKIGCRVVLTPFWSSEVR